MSLKESLVDDINVSKSYLIYGSDSKPNVTVTTKGIWINDLEPNVTVATTYIQLEELEELEAYECYHKKIAPYDNFMIHMIKCHQHTT